jgi:small subunit ribosomal protein S6
MPLYEFLCLAKPALARPHLARMMQRVGELVMADGGIVTDVTSYGEQHLAYDIRKPFQKYEKVSNSMQRRERPPGPKFAPSFWRRRLTPLPPPMQAHIWQLNFISKPETLAKVDQELKLNPEALRWLVTKRSRV